MTKIIVFSILPFAVVTVASCLEVSALCFCFYLLDHDTMILYEHLQFFWKKKPFDFVHACGALWGDRAIVALWEPSSQPSWAASFAIQFSPGIQARKISYTPWLSFARVVLLVLPYIHKMPSTLLLNWPMRKTGFGKTLELNMAVLCNICIAIKKSWTSDNLGMSTTKIEKGVTSP